MAVTHPKVDVALMVFIAVIGCKFIQFCVGAFLAVAVNNAIWKCSEAGGMKPHKDDKVTLLHTAVQAIAKTLVRTAFQETHLCCDQPQFLGPILIYQPMYIYFCRP